jgi:hypothetical protein
MIIPEHVQIETINGVCTSRCNMCSYKSWKREPIVMGNGTFRKILEKFKPYREHIQYLSMQGCGEPLLDKEIAEKVKIAKEMGFRGVGFATNATELNEQTSIDLIKAGLDTILCGIDGINKHTHETIRVGTNFEKIVSNVNNFIKTRGKLGKTRVMIRFIRQEINKHEWPLFVDYWSKQLDKTFGDEVVKFDIHNCAGDVEGYEEMDPNRALEFDNYVCEELSKRIVIFSNGEIALCNADINGFCNLESAIDCDPIEVFNGKVFNYYRKMMEEGKISELDPCKHCTIPRSRAFKDKD